MKKLIIIFFVIMVIKPAYSQSIGQLSDFEKYDKFYYTANVYYVDKDFTNALSNYKKALKIIPDDSPEIYFKAASAAMHLVDFVEAKSLLIESVKLTNPSIEYFLSYKEFDPFRSNALFAEIEKEYPMYQAEFFNNLEHPEIYAELLPFVKNNSLINNTNGNFYNKKTADIYRLIEITKTYGWQDKGWHILWQERGSFGKHNEIWDFFKPFIDSQIKFGLIRKNFWAIFEEQAHVSKYQTQIYGLFWSQLDEYPIIDIENVDKRLNNAGLPPLWYMRKVLGVKIPEAYKGTPETSSL